MAQLLKLTLCLLTWIPGSLCQVTTTEEFAVLEGRSVTVPCLYDPQYAGNVKYWCQGKVRGFCTTLSRTDTPNSSSTAEEKVIIFDDQAQLVFTVTMRDLKEEDSGWYWCGVELGNMWTVDDFASTYINVIHGMSVVNSRVSGEEGSSVTVECLYSERYRDSVKKWCRSGDWSSCLLTGSESRYEDTSVAIIDDRTGAFTITLKELQMKDAGWYLCAAGQQQMSVYVLVTPRPFTSNLKAESVTSPPTPSQPAANLLATKPSAQESRDTDTWHLGLSEAGLLVTVCVVLAAVVIVGLYAVKMIWNVHAMELRKRQAEELKANPHDYHGDPGFLQNTAVVVLNKDSRSVHVF
ncbi:polymeric immunoglobulin receptor isoform X2 [Myripristis murdjan]|uniref:Polymeric immunoglobulin receptor n=1 Tax=Myripristis murdjan TaxID=586833 RepID=A0A667WCD1_9TELE|nr:polymeric immunoglobulin receptor-like isoform X2 [Myripristis murdjan]